MTWSEPSERVTVVVAAAPLRGDRPTWIAALGLLLWYVLAGFRGQPASETPASAGKAPASLHETGLYLPGTLEVDPRNLPFVPQYPLWTDGAAKRRWIRLPEGQAIDASDPDAWQFPAGTRLWKEFSFGRRVETRYMERLPDSSWRFATYVWSEDGREARLAPDLGVKNSAPSSDHTAHDIPGQVDCIACHEGRRSPVLGFSALQLSPERDPNALHAEALPAGAVDLMALAARGLVRGLPEEVLRQPPRIAGVSATARSALGYLYGNCSGCHNSEGPLASLDLDFDQHLFEPGDARVLDTALGAASRFMPPGQSQALRISPGAPEQSALVYRMSSRFAASQMPPLGTELVDTAAVELVRAWITRDL